MIIRIGFTFSADSSDAFLVKAVRSLILLPALVVLMGVGSCNKPKTEACAERFPRFDEGLKIALMSLDTYKGRIDRAIASDEPKLPLEEREKWMKWSEHWLEEAQLFMDLAEQDQSLVSLKEALSKASDDLVSFRGYASLGKRARMVMLLTRIRDSGRSVAAVACNEGTSRVRSGLDHP